MSPADLRTGFLGILPTFFPLLTLFGIRVRALVGFVPFYIGGETLVVCVAHTITFLKEATSSPWVRGRDARGSDGRTRYVPFAVQRFE
jgi:hypothetical protein